MELIVQTTLPTISGNYDALKAQLLEGIKLYEIEVTEENLPEAKKMATELNKLSQVINKVKVEKVKEISGPIEVFKAQVAELVEICQSGREKILAQVKVFEDKTRTIAKDLMEAEFVSLMNEAGIRPEMRTETVDDLVTLSCVSKTGKLTKAARDSLVQKVAVIKALQDKVDMRLLQLENAGLKAGLKSPLRREHVEPFLMAPDDQYEINLSRIIGIEVQRQAETQEKLQADRPLQFFACVACRYVVTDHHVPANCPKCQGKSFTLHPSLAAAQASGTPKPPPPPLPPPMPIQPAAQPPAPRFNQERLHQMRQHLGDQVFFQMFKIVYEPISERAILDAVTLRPDLTDALNWAKEA